MLQNTILKFQTLGAVPPCIKNKNCLFFTQVATLKYYAPPKPPVFPESEWPEQRKLRVIEKQPNYGSNKPPRMYKMLKLFRGPEEVHNTLIYKGFGIKALLGGRMRHEHFEKIRMSVNKKLNTDRSFALWRVDPPWQPVSKRGAGKRMGGGKSAIHHYVTPVKADRIILEIGGDIEEIEARWLIGGLAETLPFPAKFVSHKDLEREKAEEERIEKYNKNPFTMEYMINNNMGGCKSWLSKYDYKWFGKYK